MSSDLAAQSLPYRLPAVLDLRNVAEVRDALLRTAGQVGPVAIDGSQVARMSTAGAQVLLAFQHYLTKQGRSFALTDPSSALEQALEFLGLGRMLVKQQQDDGT